MRANPRPGYKQTEIGEIPEEWKIRKMNEVAEIIGGGTPSTKNKDYWNGSIPFVTPTDITKLKGNFLTYTEKSITAIGLKNTSAKLIPEGSILMASRATIGFCAINNVQVVTNQGFANYICKDNICNLYLLYFIISIRQRLNALASGSTFKEISRKSLRKLKIPLPPLSEQKKIASILSTVDGAIQKTDIIIAETEELKKGLMKRLLTRGIGHTRFKKTEIGEIPREWDITKLGKICNFLDHLRVPLKQEERTKIKGNYPYYGAQGIIDWINDFIFDGDYILLAEDGANLRSRQLSIAYKVSGRFWVNNHAHVLEIKDKNKVDDSFLTFHLNYINILFYVVGSAQPKLNQKEAQNISLPLPEIYEQKKISNLLSTVDKKIEIEEKKKEKLKQLKKGLMQVLLTGKVRVKVGENA